jgi:hypothetical protein
MKMKSIIELAALQPSNNSNLSGSIQNGLKRIHAILRSACSRTRSAWNAGGLIEQRAKQMKEERVRQVLRSHGRIYL